MQAIKAVVIGLGVLIVISFALLVYGFYTRLTDPDFRVTRTDGPAGPPETAVGVPEGCAVIEMQADEDRLYLRLDGDDAACRRILVIDAGRGRHLRTVTLEPASPERP
ncbi:MAG: hypothetical protein EA406_02925 [Rhodospirillales bacterium]|nr:MAG: hypothetical protein EA406_02925 [Rhodospirillales bacterium]